MHQLMQSPMDLASPSLMVNITEKIAYDHVSQKAFSIGIDEEEMRHVLMASTTQTYRNSGQPYDNDQD